MIGSRAWFALMRRNLIYRKRYFISGILELLIPIFMVYVLVLIKNAVDSVGDLDSEIIEASFPTEYDAFSPLVFDDYLTALQAKRNCTIGDNDDFFISGYQYNGFDWQVPLIKCDSRLCNENGQDASTSLCEYNIIGVAGNKTRALQFVSWLEGKYPILADRSKLPFNFSLIRSFESGDEMDTYVTSIDYGKYPMNPKLAIGIIFNDDDNPNMYDYTIRQNSTNFNSPEQEGRPATRTTPNTEQLLNEYTKDDRQACVTEGGTPYLGSLEYSCAGQYMYNGVLTFQRLINDFIIDQTTGDDSTYVGQGSVQYAPFPSRSYKDAGFYAQIGDFSTIIIALGLLYPVAVMSSYIAQEKELRQKELLKMMSVTESDIGSSWFVTFFMFHIITATAVAFVSDKLYDQSDFITLWIFWILTFITIIVFCMTIGAITSKAIRAVLFGVLIFFVGAFLPIAVSFDDGDVNLIRIISIHPVAAFSYGLAQIGHLEDQGIGLSFDTLGSSAGNVSGYSFSRTIGSLIFDCIFWGALCWYANRVVRPDYGQALPFYFPFLPSYWCPGRQAAPISENDDAAAGSQNCLSTDVPYEPVGDGLRRQASEGKSIEIYNLQKTFGEKTAVDGLSLSMYSGQITALLGHNGAGKTTTIAMLTGALEPTGGYAVVAGKDIRTQMQAIRQDIGICLQHDCLFPMLTVREHLVFFSRLKGLFDQMTPSEANEHIDQAIRDVALFEKRNTYSKSLSGGMKRKLSVAIAFSGGSKVVLLDEPTSGMDPFSRRFTWNVIRQYRQDRCIILTTHFMDEADILGDRIAIMAEGQLRCAGSSMFLKKTYGVGYQLTIEKTPEQHSANGNEDTKNGQLRKDKATEYIEDDDNMGTQIAESTSDAIADIDERLHHIIKKNVLEASLLNNTGSEVRYQLPIGASSNFLKMFEGLDRESDKGSIQSYGVSITTLDEVFLLVARGDHTSDSKPILSSSRKKIGVDTFVDDDLENNNTAAGNSKSERSTATSRMDLKNDGLFLRHVSALTRKRAANFSRDKKAWFCTTLAPTMAVLLGLIFVTFLGAKRNLDPITLNLVDLNADISDTPKNPIFYNSPDDPFLCQPARCGYSPDVVESFETNEVYGFCGYLSRSDPRIWDNPPSSCSASLSNEIMNNFDKGGTPQTLDSVGSITNSSLALYNTSAVFRATQYGAILFTHDPTSVIAGSGANFSDVVYQNCLNKSASFNYTSPDQCANRYGGHGYVIQYNFTALHVAPLFQALADEAIIRQATNNDQFRIKVTIAPLPVTNYEEGLGASEDSFYLFVLVVISFPIIAGAFGAFIVTERESKAKHLQTVAGVEPAAYWISSLLWDTLNYQIPLWLTIALFFIFKMETLTTTDNDVFPAILTLLFLYGPAAAAYTYCLSFAFTSPSVCTMVSIISGFLVGLAGPLAIFIMQILSADPTAPSSKLENAASIVTWVLRFNPTFCLGKGLFFVLNLDIVGFIEGKQGAINAWTKPVLLLEVVFLGVHIVGYLILAILLDMWSTNPAMMSIGKQVINIISFKWLCPSHDAGDTQYETPDDSDVIREEERVLSGGANGDLIVISQLMKVYDNGKKAVDNVSLGIPHGTCFGLLGINGAGKTTTMAMLTAEFPPTSGDATLAGYSVSREPQKTRRRIGYCPQFDAHFANMTGREHVELYASIKGVPKTAVKEAAAIKLKEVGLSDFDSDRLCSNYSGGMKRRLSLAIATIGAPQIVFLDECSTGVDPVARREIWEMISDMVSDETIPLEDRTSVILTTHSMEECEALCPRIGIMANGKLRCLGSAQHLKNKFGKGYQVELKTAMVNIEDEDFKSIIQKLLQSKGASEQSEDSLDDVFFTSDESSKALKTLTDDDFLSNMVCSDNPIGYIVWKDSESLTGVSLNTLAAFATNEIRMRNVDLFLQDEFSGHTLRERQDQKARYEVSSDGTRISDIFGKIEANKTRLRLDDYGVSQTSLEQVFNMHAAEAERFKQGRNDG